jgi:hypothetical protein
MRILKKLIGAIAAAVLVPVLLFEEWGWEPLARALHKLSRLPIWAHLENGLRALPSWAAVMVFFAPMLLLLPVKLLGLFLLGEGHAKSAVILLLVAKVVGTATLAWLFQLLEPALMRIPVFARWYPRWKAWKDGLLETVRQSAPFKAVRSMKNGARRWWRSVRRAP